MSDSKGGVAIGDGIGFTGLLTVAFVVLKLTHFIEWSWWWVCSPIWISAALVAGIMLIGVAVVLVLELVKP